MSAITETFGRAAVLRALSYCAEESGGVVHMLADHHYVPSLIARSGRTVFLYEFVEGLEEFADFDVLAEEFDLSFRQVSGALGFLRKAAMMNPAGWDADAEEEDRDSADPEFIAALRHSLQNREGARVLDVE